MFVLGRHGARLKQTAVGFAERLCAATRGRAPRLRVAGAVGSGRRTVAEHLREDPRIVVVELRELDEVDAPLLGLVQAAAHLPGFEALIADPGVGGGAAVDSDLRTRAAEVARRIAAEGRAVAIVVPESWAEAESGDDAAAAHRARALLEGLLSIEDLGVALVGSLPRELGRFEEVRLDRIRLAAGDVAIDAVPATLRDAAERLAWHMASSGRSATPLELRLRLGLVRLGVAPASVADMSLVALAKQLARKLPRPLAIGTQRLLLARAPLPRAAVPQVTGLSGAELDLVVTCVGYGDDKVRVPAQTRAVLREQFRYTGHRASADELEAGHDVLASHYEALDGQAQIDGLSPGRAIAWLEKVHHLASGGSVTEARWAEQRLFGRELIWSRARSLSLRRKYLPATRLYEASLARFGDHPYAHHYLAFNLERAHGERAAIEHHYREAVRLDETNPWWNGRLVTFLIAHGTYDDARRAWREAVERVDPGGMLVEERSWLALHMHRWVARRWLTLGYITEAREVLDEIPPRFVAQEHDLRQLAHEVEDAEEARRLGDSVYPPDVPMARRWSAPGVLAERAASGARLEAWWAGRVVDVGARGVRVVLAQPDEAQHVTFTADEWRALTGEAAEDARGYLELGHYADGTRIARRVPSEPFVDDTDDAGQVMGRVAPWRD